MTAAATPATIDLSGRTVGGSAPAFVIAEAGVNHNGDPALAHALIDAALGSGADAVKFQTFDAAAVVAAGAKTADYQADAGAGDDQQAMLRSLELPLTVWAELRDHARSAGLGFLSTAFDTASLDVVIGLGVDALKVPSGEIDNVRYLEAHGRAGLPVLASTGMATMAEVRRAAELLADAPGLAFFHCVSSYPAPLESANLRAIVTMADELGVPIGWSDHTEGTVTAVAARALGAAMFEKHLTLDRGLSGPDHQASADPAQFRAYVDAIRATETALGTGTKAPHPVERELLTLARRSHHAVMDLPAGTVLRAEHTVLLRPATGIPASERVEGRRTARPIAGGHALEWDDLA